MSQRVRNAVVVASFLGGPCGPIPEVSVPAFGCTATQPAAGETDDVAKRDALARISETQDRWHRVAWGQERPASARVEEARLFECVWDGLRARDVDPLPDLECLARAMSAAADCQSAGKPVRECNGAFEQACTFSAAYLDVTKGCRADTK
jgi:hypothetical protein